MALISFFIPQSSNFKNKNKILLILFLIIFGTKSIKNLKELYNFINKTIGKVKKTSLELIRDLILTSNTKTKNEASFLIEDKLIDSSLSKSKFLFANLSNLKFSDISDLKNYIELFDLKIKGIILLVE